MVSQISNPDMTVFKPMQSSGVPFAITKAITPQQQKDIENKKEKKTHKLGKTVAISTIITGLAIIGLMKGPKSVRKIFQNIEKKIKKSVKNQQSLNWIQKQGIKGFEKLKKYKGYANTVLNVATYKDIWFKHQITDRIPLLKTTCKKISKLFEKISINSVIKKYGKLNKRFTNLYTDLYEINSKLPANDQKIIQNELNKVKVKYDNHFGTSHITDRLIELDKRLEPIDKEFWGQTLDNFKEFVKTPEAYNTFLAEKIAAPTKAVNSKLLTGVSKDMAEDLKNILNTYEAFYREGKITEKEYKTVNQQITKAIKSMHNAVNAETDKLFDKIRDIKLGSAPTDFMGIIGSFIAAGFGLAQADGKDEKISVSLEYGIPAIGGVATSLFCATCLIPAGPALIIGTLSGIAMSKIGSIINNKRKYLPSSPQLINDAKKIVTTGSINNN